MRNVIEKTLVYVLKDLSKDIQLAIKLNKIPELKSQYSNLPTVIMTRFYRNYGVKAVAQKHLKDFLLCLKNIQKHTNKYSVFWYFMCSDENS